MRTWPYQMLDVLPTKQLVSQWRECLAISSMIYQNDSFKNGDIDNLSGIKHTTINRIKDYKLDHFLVYCDLVRKEFKRRGFTIGQNTIDKLNKQLDFEERLKELKVAQSSIGDEMTFYVNEEKLFGDFHNSRYIRQCVYSFQEKYDCKSIKDEEWDRIKRKFNYLFSNNIILW